MTTFVRQLLKGNQCDMEEKYENCSDNFKALNDALYVVSGKWKIPILGSILSGNHKFREIQRSIPKLSTKVLASELKFLEENHLITRTVFEDIPFTILYEPTEHAKSLGKVLNELIEWGKIHNKEVKSFQINAQN